MTHTMNTALDYISDYNRIYNHPFGETTPERNIPLLRKCAEWVEDQYAAYLRGEKSEWLQARFVVDFTEFESVLGLRNIALDQDQVALNMFERGCGTVACVAGKIALDSGYKIGKSYVLMPNQPYMTISDFAKKELGITGAEADVLFEADNSAGFIREFCEYLAGEPL